MESFYDTMPASLRALVDQAAALTAVSPDTADLAARLVDHTSLKEAAPMLGGESAADIAALCAMARTMRAAAVCVYPNRIEPVLPLLVGSAVRLAVVNNFPHGADDAPAAATAARLAVHEGAAEIDTVIDYVRFLDGDRAAAAAKLQAVYAAVKDAGGALKTILTATAYRRYDDLYAAALLAIDAGCDFVKTCTGKMPLPGYGGPGPDVSNLPVAAAVMQAVADSGGAAGVKISGGVATALDCERMRFLHAHILGSDNFTPTRFRFGASSLLKNLQDGTSLGRY